MLGKAILDPYNVESNMGKIKGIGLLDTITTIEDEKVMARVEGNLRLSDFNGNIYGYEIHMGKSIASEGMRDLVQINRENGAAVCRIDGICSNGERIIGTYIHGILDSTEFREYLLNKIRYEKSIPERKSPVYEGFRDKEINKLTDIVREALDMNKIYEIAGLK